MVACQASGLVFVEVILQIGKTKMSDVTTSYGP